MQLFQQLPLFYFSVPEVLLSGEINLKVSLKGFPTPVTSALTLPSPQGTDQYQHYVFSGRKEQPDCMVLAVIANFADC